LAGASRIRIRLGCGLSHDRSDNSRWCAGGEGVRWDRARHNRDVSHHAALADRDAAKNNHFEGQPHVSANLNRRHLRWAAPNRMVVVIDDHTVVANQAAAADLNPIRARDTRPTVDEGMVANQQLSAWRDKDID